MKLITQNRHILSFLFFLPVLLLSEECVTLNPNNYGNCEDILGYVWNGQECSITYGCDTNDDEFYYID